MLPDKVVNTDAHGRPFPPAAPLRGVGYFHVMYRRFLWLGVVCLVAAAFAYSFFFSMTHATIQINLNDVGLATKGLSWQSLRDARVTFKDTSGVAVAYAHSVAPLHYVVVSHPNPQVGDCRQFEEQATQHEYARCFDTVSKWASSWSPLVRSARIMAGQCDFGDVPISVVRHPAE
jgi:hypothetical protein